MNGNDEVYVKMMQVGQSQATKGKDILRGAMRLGTMVITMTWDQMKRCLRFNRAVDKVKSTTSTVVGDKKTEADAAVVAVVARHLRA